MRLDIRIRRRTAAAGLALAMLASSAGCAGLATADWPPVAAAAPGLSTATSTTSTIDPWQAVRAAAATPSGRQPLALQSYGFAAPTVPPAPAPLTFARGSGLPTSLAAPVLVTASASSPSLPDPFAPRALIAPELVSPSPNAVLAPAVVRRSPRLQCVPYARAISGIEIYGNANTWWRQADGRFVRNDEPALGAVIAMRGYRNPNRGHVAVVTGIRSEREILVDHANWLNRGEISVRTPMLDVSPDGDWSQVRVWHIPSNRWGARVYSVHGFIHQG